MFEQRATVLKAKLSYIFIYINVAFFTAISQECLTACPIQGVFIHEEPETTQLTIAQCGYVLFSYPMK